MLFPLPPEGDRLWLERELLGRGATLICGVDEAGRGPLAGPVVAAAVILPLSLPLAQVPPEWRGLDDSKRLTPAQRERQEAIIRRSALAVGVAEVSAAQIDDGDILSASLLAMRQAVESLATPPDYVLVDGNFRIPHLRVPQRAVVRGDSLSASVAAASIVAKVHRDRLMAGYHEIFPQYGFRSNKGYATRDHLAAIGRHGCCPVHRRSFRGVLSPTRSALPPAPPAALGASCEEEACTLLTTRGYEIVARNWRCPRGEIDIVARHGEVLVFVEVRARSRNAFGGPAASVTAAKQRKLSLAALEYLDQTGQAGACARFDVVVFCGRGVQRRGELIRNAFELCLPEDA